MEIHQTLFFTTTHKNEKSGLGTRLNRRASDYQVTETLASSSLAGYMAYPITHNIHVKATKVNKSTLYEYPKLKELSGWAGCWGW